MKTTNNPDAPVAMLGLTNPDAEIAVLHAMRTEMTAAIDLVAMLEESDFYDVRRGIVFEAIRLLLLGIEPIDTASILAEVSTLILERKLKVTVDEEYVESLNVGDVRRHLMYANSVKKLSWLRKAGDFAFWLVQELQGRPKPDSLFAEAQEKWQMLAPKGTDDRFVYGWDTLKEHRAIMMERLKDRETGARIRYDWPWASWNARIRPLQGGFIGILAAADGMGKTTYLEEVAEHWASKGIQTVYVHLEDNIQYKLDRRLARHARVDIAKIQDADLTPDEAEKVNRAVQKMEEWAGNLHYLDAAGESMTTILRELQSKVDEGVCQAIIFDYLDKTQPSRGQIALYSHNTWERQANDMELLKVFCTKNDIVGFTATQGNKAIQGPGTQTRASIQGSGQKSQKSQLVLILQRQLVGEEGLRDPDGNLVARPGQYSPVVKVRIDKQNIGQTGDFQQYMIGKFFCVRDIPSAATVASTPVAKEVRKAEENPENMATVPLPYKDE